MAKKGSAPFALVQKTATAVAGPFANRMVHDAADNLMKGSYITIPKDSYDSSVRV